MIKKGKLRRWKQTWLKGQVISISQKTSEG